MKQIVSITALIIISIIAIAPCMLILTEGEDGSITIWNFVGLAYLIVLCWAVDKLGIINDNK